MVFMARRQRKSSSENAQIIAMHGLFPRFKHKRGKNGSLIFEGPLFVLPVYDEYTIRIEYRVDLDPRVWVLDPQLVDDAPHRYQNDGSLCLYRPDLFVWRPSYLITDYVIGWVAAWIYFYEIWKETGKWNGPEAHGSTNEIDNEQNDTTSNCNQSLAVDV